MRKYKYYIILAKCVCCVGEAIKCACAFLGRANQYIVVREYCPPLKRDVLSNFRTVREPDGLGRNSYGLVESLRAAESEEARHHYLRGTSEESPCSRKRRSSTV